MAKLVLHSQLICKKNKNLCSWAWSSGGGVVVARDQFEAPAAFYFSGGHGGSKRPFYHLFTHLVFLSVSLCLALSLFLCVCLLLSWGFNILSAWQSQCIRRPFGHNHPISVTENTSHPHHSLSLSLPKHSERESVCVFCMFFKPAMVREDDDAITHIRCTPP